jgi:acyl-CoA thioester hydrolase
MEAFVNNNTKTAPADPQQSSKKSGTRCNYPRFRTITTRWMDNDVYGHVNNVVYYSFFDTAVNAPLIDEGLLDPKNGDVIGLVVETGCRYASALSFPETVDAGIRVAHIGNSSVRFEVGLFKQGNDVAAAEGFFVHVYVGAVTRRPTPIPPALRSFLEGLT